jgi:phage protein D
MHALSVLTDAIDLTTGMTAAATAVSTQVNAALPIALPIGGAILALGIGWKLFKRFVRG